MRCRAQRSRDLRRAADTLVPHGAWRSLVSALVWGTRGPGSNPGAPTEICVRVSLYPREVIETPRLVLVPISGELADAILGGDLTGVQAAEGWPDASILVPFRVAVKAQRRTARVVRDARRRGHRRLSYARSSARGRGHRDRLRPSGAISRPWLRHRAGRSVFAMVARSARYPARRGAPCSRCQCRFARRVLERVGFVLERSDEQHTWYALSRD